MAPPYTLTVLSEDGYQVFAALNQRFHTLPEAIEGAREDYRTRYGGTPALRVYHADDDGSGAHHVLIEACFDSSKRRSFVALYKVIREDPAVRTGQDPPRPSALAALGRCG